MYLSVSLQSVDVNIVKVQNIFDIILHVRLLF